MRSLIVLTGAGMSAESGLATFRGSGGLWEGYDVEEVASVSGWRRNPERVLEFYNLRREQAFKAKPNKGHIALAELESDYKVTIITQNVDDLHERAGSSNVLHLHGELTKARSSKRPELVYEIADRPIHLGDFAEDGSQLRPHIVWFGEEVPMIQVASERICNADLLLVIGTSLSVYPAAGLVDLAQTGIPKIIIDPAEPDRIVGRDWRHIRKKSTIGTPQLVNELLSGQ